MCCLQFLRHFTRPIRAEYEIMANERRPFHGDREQREYRFGAERRERRDYSERIMYDAECEKCHAAFQVPFQPEPGRTILCRDCLRDAREKEGGEPRRERGNRGERGYDRNYEHRHNRDHHEHEEKQYEITCSHCGKKDTVPFKPYEGSIVLCHECMNNPNVSRVGGKIYHTIICAACGKENKVPFQPDPGSRVLCRECHLKEREEKQRAREYYAKHHPSVLNGTKVSIEIRCERCGCKDVLPFVPKTHGAILCRQCAEQTFGDEWARRNRVGAREYPFTCTRCGAQDFVPFKPKEDQELLCKHCLNDQAILRHSRDEMIRHDEGSCIRTASHSKSAQVETIE